MTGDCKTAKDTTYNRCISTCFDKFPAEDVLADKVIPGKTIMVPNPNYKPKGERKEEVSSSGPSTMF